VSRHTGDQHAGVTPPSSGSIDDDATTNPTMREPLTRPSVAGHAAAQPSSPPPNVQVIGGVPQLDLGITQLSPGTAVTATPSTTTTSSTASPTLSYGDFKPGVVVSKWKLLEKIGKGGSAKVFKVQHTETHRYAAMKVLAAQRKGAELEVQLSKLAAEVRTFNEKVHPSIVHHLDANLSEPTYWIVTELLDGRPLDEVIKAQGRPVSRKRVARKMREAGLRGRKRRPFKATTNSKHSRNVPDNLLRRDFTASAPNRVWVTDVTAICTGTGWLYLAAILDLFSRAVVGWATSATNDTELALTALRQAYLVRRPPPGLIHHSDRGAPYASDLYRGQLKAYGMRPSMSRTGDCWDNAAAESFFASIKGEWLDHDWHPSRAAGHRAVAEYIDSFYNPLRRHSSIGYLSPDEFELRAHLATLAA